MSYQDYNTSESSQVDFDESLKPITPIASSGTLNPKHIEEFLGSGIPQEIALQGFYSLNTNEAIGQKLGWKYDHTPGWLTKGVSIVDGVEPYHQFKPDTPLPSLKEGQKPNKYLSPKGKKPDAILLKHPDINWVTVRDSNLPIEVTEGGKKSESFMCHTKTPCVAIIGVENGLSSGKNGQKRELVPQLKALSINPREFILSFDADIVEKPTVKNALLSLGKELEKHGHTVNVRLWDIAYGKGIDDVIVSGNFDKTYIISFSDFRAEHERKFTDLLQIVNDILSDHKFIYYNQSFYQLDSEKCLHKKVSNRIISNLIMERCKKIQVWNKPRKIWERPFCDESKYLKLEKMMARECAIDDINPGSKIPFLNGVLDPKSRKLEPHGKEIFTWVIPFDYIGVITNNPIKEMLVKFFDNGEKDYAIFTAWLAGCLRGERLGEIFVELLGKPGTGKSAVVQLIQNIIGRMNVSATKLDQIENNRFEMASLIEAKLVVLNEVKSFDGGNSQLLSLVGRDKVRIERKFESAKKDEDDIFKGNVIMVGNTPARFDNAPAIERRRRTLYANTVIPPSERRDLFNTDYSGDLDKFIPAFIAELIQIDRSTSKKILETANETILRINSLRAQLSDPLGEWINSAVRFNRDRKVQAGRKYEGKDADGSHRLHRAYTSYTYYCIGNGLKPLNSNNFKQQFLARCESLKVQVRHENDGRLSYYWGIELCDTEIEESQSIINMMKEEEQKIPPPKHQEIPKKEVYQSDYPDEKITYPDEKITYPDEKITYPDEKITYPDEKITYPDEKITYPDEPVEPITPEINPVSIPENLKPTTQSPYKVGDRIQIGNKLRTDEKAHGKLATIISVGESTVRVRFDYPISFNPQQPRSEYKLDFDEFALYEPPTKLSKTITETQPEIPLKWD